MNPVIIEHQTQIVDLCRQHQVRRLEAFDPTDKPAITPFGMPPYEVAFAIEFVKDAEDWGQFSKLANLERDLGKALDCRVHVAELRMLKKSNERPTVQRILQELEPVYG